MRRLKDSLVLGFAIFAAFFGAGNLILPPSLGVTSGDQGFLVSLGFMTSAAFIPLLALFGHSRLQGSMSDFGKKVSPLFGTLFSIGVYIIAIVLPCPRTAAVTYEMSVSPYLEVSPLVISSLYFGLVFLFVVNRGKALEILGKFLTPVIGGILLLIILIGSFTTVEPGISGTFEQPLIAGFLEGYQTYDALAGLLIGGVLVISVKNYPGYHTESEKKQLIASSGFVAICGLFIIYAGLLYVGSRYSGTFDPSMSRTAVLSGLSMMTLGNMGTAALSVLVGLACFTTAVGIIVGTADFFKEKFNGSERIYRMTAVIACLLGIFMGQFEVRFIIDIAVSILMLTYPLAIVLILLNLLPERLATKRLFRLVVGVAFLFSIPDFLKVLIPQELLVSYYDWIPLSKSGMGWVLPCLLVTGATMSFDLLKKKPDRVKGSGL